MEDRGISKHGRGLTVIVQPALNEALLCTKSGFYKYLILLCDLRVSRCSLR
jgi:hypothetical protein